MRHIVRMLLVLSIGGVGFSGAAEEGAIDEEIAKCRRAVIDNPEAVDAWNSLGSILMQASRSRHDPALYDEAEAAFRQVMTVEPESAPAAAGLAWVYNSRHAFDEGIEWAEKALEFDSKNQHAHALLGDAYVEYGDYDEAFGHYQSALDIRPDLSSYSRAAHLLFLTGDFRRAQLAMQKAIKAGGPHPENGAWCRAQLGLMMFKNGALVPAETVIAAALEEAPDNAHVLQTMAEIKAAREDYTAAIDLYEKAITQWGTHGFEGALLALADVHRCLGDMEKASACEERLIAACKTAAEAHRHGDLPAHVHPPDLAGDIVLAQFYADRDRNLGEALKIARAASRTYKNVYVFDTLAWCYYKAGDLDNARKTIRKALRWNTPEARFLYHAGMIEAKRGDSTEARKYLYRALSLNPKFHPIDAKAAADALAQLAKSGRGNAKGEPDRQPITPPE